MSHAIRCTEGRRHDAWVREYQLTEEIPTSHAAGDFQFDFDLKLTEEWILHAHAFASPEQHDKLMAVLIAVVESAEVTGGH